MLDGIAIRPPKNANSYLIIRRGYSFRLEQTIIEILFFWRIHLWASGMLKNLALLGLLFGLPTCSQHANVDYDISL